jgi:uncharacterized protein (DUF924 family)
MAIKHPDIIEFWFSDRIRANWWTGDPALDQELRDRFSSIHQQASHGELATWRSSPEGRLAEIIVLDQFSRNMFRGHSSAFACDEQARALTYEAVVKMDDRALAPGQRAFLYMPLMHSESADDHDEAVRLFSSDPALSNNLNFELKHKAIIGRFGRYPHRNEILGRESSAEEIEFLRQPDSSF